MKNQIKLAIVDDHHLFREGLISLTTEYKDLNVVIEASNGKELIEQIEKRKVDVVLLDIEMPIMDGFEVTRYLKKNYPEIKILILTMYNDEEIIRYLIGTGAHGFLLKNSSIANIIDAIYSVTTDNGYYFNDSVSKSMVQDLVSSKKIKPYFHKSKLSARELEVMRLICKEYTNKEIACSLFLSLRTVDGHRENILNKIKAKNTAGIVMYAVKNNLLAIKKARKVV
ncbi:MAG: response regulator transcription factor [Bacteroidota bacterium]